MPFETCVHHHNKPDVMAQTRRRSLFRPCIDLHNGEVKQIVGGTLNEADPSHLQTNFVAR